MRISLVRLASMTLAALLLCAAIPAPADASGQKTPLAVAQAAYKEVRASNGATIISSALTEVALKSGYNVEINPDGYVGAYGQTIPDDHGIALLVNVVHGGFGCVRVGPTVTHAPTSLRCPVAYFAFIVGNVNVPAKYLLATQVASALGVEANYLASAKTGSAVSSAVPKIFKLASGFSATRDAQSWTVTVHAVSVCLSFTSKGAYAVRSRACSRH